MIAGIIVAGGRGSRIGDPLKCVPLLPRLVAALRGAGCGRIVIAGDHDGLGLPGCEVVRDASPGRGPLGGIVAGLRACPGHDAAIIVAGDHLHLAATDLRRLAGAWRRGRRAHWAWAGRRPRPQPLCGIMPLTALAAAEAALAGGRLGVHRLWRGLGARPLWWNSEAAFADLDRPGDLALHRWGRTARISSMPNPRS